MHDQSCERRHASCLEHAGPINGMGLQNVFANDVVTDRPVALEQLTIGTVECGSVV